MKISNKIIFFISLIVPYISNAQQLKYSNFDQWIVREIPESGIIGGKTKILYEIGPNDTIKGAKAYIPTSSPWATSNVYARVMGVNKGSVAVYPDKHGSGRCVKLTTKLDSIQALHLVNIEVLVGGSMFLGKMLEPVKSTSDPYSKMEMGVPFTGRPKSMKFDYKVYIPNIDHRIICTGFSKKKEIAGRDSSEVFIILQRRWEDDGKIYAKRVGTGRERFHQSTHGWIEGHTLDVKYGDITKHADYRPWMGLIPEDKSYYAQNSKGKMVPVHEIGWDSPDAPPTHILIMASAACGTAYVGTPGQTLWIDNIELVY